MHQQFLRRLVDDFDAYKRLFDFYSGIAEMLTGPEQHWRDRLERAAPIPWIAPR